MKLITYIGRRFLHIHKSAFSKPTIRIASSSIALSITVVVMAIIIVKGFQLEVRNKVIGFGGHIRIKTLQISAVDDIIPISFKRDDIIGLPERIPDIFNIQAVAEKAGIIKTDDQIEGCVFKGITYDYSKQFIVQNLVSGKFPDISQDRPSDEIIISQIIADRLFFSVGDTLRMYFLIDGEHQPRGRRFIITGIYNTGMGEFDQKYIFGDIKHIQRLNGWMEDEAGTVEILVKNYSTVQKTVEEIQQYTDYDIEVISVFDMYPDIFNWLLLLDMNVIVIIIIMLIVTIINIITILLIRILEKTSSIAILKSLGVNNADIRKIFIYVSTRIVLKGMLIGNFIAITLGLLQKYFSIISLDQNTYYVSTIPIHFDIKLLLILNILLFVTGVLVMLLPSIIISKITPASALRIK
jgi:lipoprotein-releasing system permease protein